MQPNKRGIRVMLADAAPSPTNAERHVDGSPLSQASIDALLARAQPLPTNDARSTFRRPAETLKPPRTGDTVEIPPPADDKTAPSVPNGPVRVLRYGPEGEVELASKVSISFDQPMVAVSSQEVTAETVPVTLDPQPPGQWRWLGTRTLVFEAEQRFPMATDYTVAVRPGAHSATGDPLQEDTNWSFQTPAPRLVASRPSGERVRTDPLVMLQFDQPVDAESVRDAMQPSGMRLATAEETEAAEPPPGAQVVYLRFPQPLSTQTKVVLTLPAGFEGLEGPRGTKEQQMVQFQTHGPLTVVAAPCRNNACSPESGQRLLASNPLDLEALVPELFEIEPPVEGLSVQGYGDAIMLGGAFRAKTTYSITVDTKLQDQFGQTLTEPTTVTTTTGRAHPRFQVSASGFRVLDPADPNPTIQVHTRSIQEIHVEIYDVGPKDLTTFYSLRNEHTGSIGTFRSKQRLQIADPDAATETAIELGRYLDQGLGQRVVHLSASAGDAKWSRWVWVQATRIGLDASTDPFKLIASATDLNTGLALPGVMLGFIGDTAQTTDADGLASFDLPSSAGANGLVATRGSDVAILPANSWSSQPWQAHPPQRWPAWFVFDDRGLYKPGETVHIRGIHRWIEPGPKGDLQPSDLGTITWTATGPRNNQLARGHAKTNGQGAFEFSFDLPEGVNLGSATVLVEAAGIRHFHRVQIADFRRPEFEVSAAMPGGPFLLGQHAKAVVKASYFAGGGLAGANVRWYAESFETSYRPPNNDDFHFGRFQPWWWARPHGGDQRPIQPAASFTSQTAADGTHTVDVHFAEGEPKPMSVTLSATVQDINRQSFSASITEIVHPSTRYVGLRSGKSFVATGEPLRIEAIATSISGERLSDVPITIEAVRQEWAWSKGSWQAQVAERHRCAVTSSTQPVECSFQPKKPGRFQLTATVTDDQGRANSSERSIWVQGGRTKPVQRVELETVLMIPDQETYQVGQTAQVFLQAPFAPADAVITTARGGFIEVRRVHFTETTRTIEVPIAATSIPGVHVLVELTGSAPRTDAQGNPLPTTRPAFASGQLELRVPPITRTLGVEVTPEETGLRPGERTSVKVGVVDAAGRPRVGADVTLWVVDEAVLALSGYRLGDPIATFYRSRGTRVHQTRFRSMVALSQSNTATIIGGSTDDRETSRNKANMMFGMADESPDPSPRPKSRPKPKAGGPITVRSDFRALAHWTANATTDASGQIEVQYTVPDSLTRYRVLALAVDGSNFGQGEAAVTARNPLMIRPSAPRFLNFGDRFELPILLQNQTDEAIEVELAAQAVNAVFLERLDQPGDAYEVGSSTTGRVLTVPAGDRVEVLLPTATDMVGVARFQFVVSGAGFSDATRIEVPVYTPATSEAFATYGVIDEGAVRQPVTTPGGVWPQFGGLEISTSSTALQALTDAVVQINSYPYGCSEQIASRVLALVAVRDVLEAFDAEGVPDAATVDAQLQRDLKRLTELQNRDGGFGFWRRGERSWPFISLHVAHAVARAHAKGFAVPPTLLKGTQGYVAGAPNTLQHPNLDDRTRRHLHAYALSISRLFGTKRPAEAERLLDHDLSLEAKGWLLPVLHEAKSRKVPGLLQEINNRTDETAGNAHFIRDFVDNDRFVLLASDRRLDGILLEALIQVDPDSDLIPKVVSGLLAHRTRGHWGSTQDNAFVLLALDRYFHTFEGVEPNFIARAWLGDAYVGKAAFKGRETKRARIQVPMGELTEQARRDLVLQKTGSGRMYYRIGLRYAPKDLELEAADRGFTVQRTYQAIDDPTDVVCSDGVCTIRKGANVRVTVEMTADARRNHVALIDPLPAGFEAINPALRGAPPNTDETLPWWRGRWYVHDNLRDDRAEAFAHQIQGGLYTYSYIAQATTPGNFVVPPARAEEMYNPETFGRSASMRVVIR